MGIQVIFTAKLRKQRVKSAEDLAYEETQRLINPDFIPEEDEIGFKQVMLDLERILDHIELDDGYVQVVTDHGTVYVLKIDWNEYLLLYEQMTHRAVFRFEDVKE